MRQSIVFLLKYGVRILNWSEIGVNRKLSLFRPGSGHEPIIRFHGYLRPALFLVCLLTILGCSASKSIIVDQKALLEVRKKNISREKQPSMDSLQAQGQADQDQPSPEIPDQITLEEAIAYAIEHNLDAAIMKLEEEIRLEAMTGARFKMLPALTITGEYSLRDDFAASYSSALTGNEGFQNYNYSRDKTQRMIGLELSWDILDFSIAYYKSKQDYGHLAIAEQRRRRVIQNLKLDLTMAFWKAQVPLEAMEIATDLIDRLKRRKIILQDQFESQTASKLDILETAAVLSEMKLKISGFEQEYQKYKLQLASLLGVPKSTDFEIAKFDFDQPLTRIQLDLKALESAALRQRPELFEQDIEESISAEEAKIALVEMAPSITAFWKYSYDDDSHLYHNQWNTIGLKLSMDLLATPYQMSRRREASKQKKLTRDRRFSMAGAILTQLNITAVEYEDTLRRYRQHAEIAQNRKQLMLTHRAHAQLGKGNAEDVLKSEGKFLLSRVRALSAFTDVMITEERILNTIGHDDPSPKPLSMQNRQKLSPEPLTESQEAADQPPISAQADKTVSLQQKQVKREPAPSAPYSLHLSSWNTRKKARKMVRAHKQAGLKAYLTKIDLGNKGIWWRVSSGRYETEEEALKVKIDHGFSDAIIRKTAYPALVGTYASKDEMQAAIRKLREPAPSVPYSLHLSSWNTRKKARKMVRVHKQAGLKAYLTKIDLGNKGIWWRVFSGCYETEEEALKVKIDRGFSDAIIIKTAYAALVGTYASKDEMQANIRKLEALGFDPYPVMGKDGIFWLYSGAYYLQIGADTHEFELTVKGIEAATALR